MKDEKKTVLIVDDDPLTRESLRHGLELHGYEVMEAWDPPMALSTIRNRFVHVVLLDLYLPGDSGLHLLREIKDLSEDTQVIIITGYASVASAVEAMNEAAFAYVEKPIDMAKLVETIERALRRQDHDLLVKKPISSRLRVPETRWAR